MGHWLGDRRMDGWMDLGVERETGYEYVYTLRKKCCVSQQLRNVSTIWYFEVTAAKFKTLTINRWCIKINSLKKLITDSTNSDDIL